MEHTNKVLKINGKIVGSFDSRNRVYTKRVHQSKHKLWKYNAYGIQSTVLNRLKELNCRLVMIEELDKKVTLRSEFDDWIESDLEEDLGHGTQKFLPESKMRKFHNI